MEVINLKLDYTLDSPEERNELVKKVLAEYEENSPDNPPSEKYLEALADYLVLCMEKQERKEKEILTDNRLATVNKRETSFEGLTAQLENGEDGIYNLINNDKNTIFQPKITITKEDLEEIPVLRQLREAINYWEEKMKTAHGRDAFIIKKTLIELRKDQYVIKNAYRKPIVPTKLTRSKYSIKLDDKTNKFDENGYPIPEGVSLMDPKCCSAILCNYSRLKEDSWDRFDDDTWYLIYDFETICDKALAPYPLYQRLLEYKIDGMQNIDIQTALQTEFGIKHSVEYISSLWRNKIPKLIAAAAVDQYLDWYYLNVEKGYYKKCNRCGQIKLGHNKYFSKNNTSKDQLYSICKECRKRKEK